MAQGIPVPANSPLDGDVHTCQFSEDWLSIVTGALSDLYFVNQWESPPSDIVAQIDTLIDLIEDNVIISPQLYPQMAQHNHRGSVVTVGNALTFSQSASQMDNGWWLQSAAAQNDRFHFDVFLEPANYTIHIIGMTASNNGKLELTVDFEDYFTTDWYSASNAFNVVKTVTGVPLGGDVQRVTGIVSDKNSSSTGYNMRLNTFVFVKE